MTRPPPPPPRNPANPRYEGPFKVINFDPNEPMNYLQSQIFVYAPYSESWQESTRRLLNAIRDDGERELRPTTIFIAYRKHKELQKPLWI